MNDLLRADGTPLRVLVVDDETMLAELLAGALTAQGWQARAASSGTQALNMARDWVPDVVVLDIMMPGLDGYEVLRRLRQTHPALPVLFLTAKDAVADRVKGLRAGADDYVTKPYSLDEVAARIEALVRRSGLAYTSQDDEVLRVADLELDLAAAVAHRGGQEIQLTKTEFDLLEYFMENPGRVLTKAQILDRVWQHDFGGQANVVELYVSYLRKKIDAGRQPLIHTRRGLGYVLQAPDA